MRLQTDVVDCFQFISLFPCHSVYLPSLLIHTNSIFQLLFSKTTQSDAPLRSWALYFYAPELRTEQIRYSSSSHQLLIKQSSSSHQAVIRLSSNSFLVKQPNVHRYKRSWALYFRAPELSSWLQYTHATAVVVYHTLLVSCSTYPRDKPFLLTMVSF